MLKKVWLGLAAAGLVGAVSAADAGKIPFVSGYAGNPQGIEKADVPWQSDFEAISAGTKEAPVATRWKAFHDGRFLYVAVECDDDAKQLAKMATLEKIGDGRNLVYALNNVEVAVDTEGKGLSFYKLAVNVQGDKATAYAVDDNTGKGTYVFSSKWDSDARIANSVGKTCWTMRVAIPLATLEGLGPTCRLGVNRQRYIYETATRNFLVIPPATGFCDAPAYRPYAFEKPETIVRDWTVGDFACKVRFDGKGLYRLETTPRFARRAGTDAATARLLVYDRNNQLQKSVTADISGDAATLATDGIKKGAATVAVEALGKDGTVLAQKWADVRVEYEPVRIRFTEPCYKDCVFDTMKLTKVAGYVVLEETAGAPLKIRLTGPETDETREIAASAKTNFFEFAFADKPKGTYELEANGVRRRLRNLPYRKNEIWIGRDGIVRRDGRKMLPYGWFSEPHRIKTPPLGTNGCNIAHSYWNGWNKDDDGMQVQLRRAGENGCGYIVSPFHPLPGMKDRNEIFSWDELRGDFAAGPKGELRRKAVRRIVDAVKKSPDFFAYYMADEPEGFGTNPDFLGDARDFIEDLDPYHPTIIVNYSADGVVKYHEMSDIMCPDCYPVYYKDGTVRDVRRISYDRPFAASSRGKATWMSPQLFDWHITVPGKPTSRGATYDEVRAQVLMGLCADARGFLLYTRSASGTVDWHWRLAPDFVKYELNEAEDVFLSPSTKVVPTLSGQADVIAATKRCGDDFVLIVVNNETHPVTVTFDAKGFPQVLHLSGETFPTEIRGGRLVAELGPCESRVYRSKPWSFSVPDARGQIEQREELRRKPGNLATPPRFLTLQEQQMITLGKAEYPYPRVTASSSADLSHRPHVFPHFLQDGFDQDYPFEGYQAWQPLGTDKAPWVRVEFGKKRTFDEVVIYRCCDTNGNYAVTSGRIEANGKVLAEFKDLAKSRVELRFPRVEADSVTFVPGPPSGRSREPWLVEIEVYDAIDIRSPLLEAEAARLEQLMEEKFFGPGDIAMASLDWDYSPWAMPQPAGRSYFDIPHLTTPIAGQRAYENSPMVMGELLAAMERKFKVTGDARARRLMARCYNGLRKVYELSQPVAPGFFCKPYGGVMSDETSSDQYNYALYAFDVYYPYATEAEKAEIREMVVKMADFWMSRDYSYKYYNNPLQWQRCRFLSFLKLAEKYSGDAKYAREIVRILSNPDEAAETPYQADIEYHDRGEPCPDGRINYGANAEAALSGFLAVHNLKGDAAGGAYYGRVLAPLTKAAVVDLDPDGAAYRALLKDDRTGEFFEKDAKYTTYRPKDSAPPPWNSDDRLVSGPLRFGGHVSAGGVNALVQMAPEYAPAADWVRANATKMLYRIAKAHLTHLEDPHGLYFPSCYWNTRVRSGDALGFWLWAYWTLREREEKR